MATEQEIRDLKRKHSATLLERPGVCGVGVEKDEDGNFVLAVHVADNVSPDLANSLRGLPVKFIHSGPFKKQ